MEWSVKDIGLVFIEPLLNLTLPHPASLHPVSSHPAFPYLTLPRLTLPYPASAYLDCLPPASPLPRLKLNLLQDLLRRTDTVLILNSHDELTEVL